MCFYSPHFPLPAISKRKQHEETRVLTSTTYNKPERLEAKCLLTTLWGLWVALGGGVSTLLLGVRLGKAHAASNQQIIIEHPPTPYLNGNGSNHPVRGTSHHAKPQTKTTLLLWWRQTLMPPSISMYVAHVLSSSRCSNAKNLYRHSTGSYVNISSTSCNITGNNSIQVEKRQIVATISSIDNFNNNVDHSKLNVRRQSRRLCSRQCI